MNFPSGRKDTQAVLQLQCSTSWTSGIHGEFIYLSSFNIFLSITGVLGNTLILVALRKVSSLHPPSKLLFRCLAATDLCVGLIAEPLGIVYWISVTQEQWKLCRYAYAFFFIVSYLLSSVSLLTISAISVDRLLALLLGLRYRQVVTLRRTYVLVVIFWLMSAVVSANFLLNPIIPSWYGYIVIPLCLVTPIASYAKIFLTLRRLQTQVRGHVQSGQINPLSIERHRKAVFSALWVQCTLVVCYLPYGIVRVSVSYSKTYPSSVFMVGLGATLVFLNSSLNPILYCWKISGVKKAVKETIREALCCLRS